MALIDVGEFGGDFGINDTSVFTFVGLFNAANDTGTIDHCDIYGSSQAGIIRFASFTVSGTTVSAIGATGDVTHKASGDQAYDAPGDFTAFDINSGNNIGFYKNPAFPSYNTTGGSGFLFKSGDWTAGSGQTFTLLADGRVSIYGEGATAGPVGRTRRIL